MNTDFSKAGMTGQHLLRALRHKRCRIMSFYIMSFLGMSTFGSLLAGTLAGRPTFAVGQEMSKKASQLLTKLNPI